MPPAASPHLDPGVAAPHGQFKHERLNHSEVGVGGFQPCNQAHVSRRLPCYIGVAVAVAAHPRAKAAHASRKERGGREDAGGCGRGEGQQLQGSGTSAS
eukprot:364100-Chlamydomonas_euryale.AAC.73